MKSFFIQKNSLLFLLGIIVIVTATIIYFWSGASAVPLQTSPITAACKSSPQRGFERGIAFPEWSTIAYGSYDTQWQTELPEMRTQTDACWVEVPVLFYQSSLTSTTVTQGPSTPSISSFTYGIRFAHAQGFHIFVTPLLTVNGPEPWSGAIHFSTAGQEQQWLYIFQGIYL